MPPHGKLCVDHFIFSCRSGNNELIGLTTTSLKDICPERFVSLCFPQVFHVPLHPTSLLTSLPPLSLSYTHLQRWHGVEFGTHQSFSQEQEEVHRSFGVQFCKVGGLFEGSVPQVYSMFIVCGTQIASWGRKRGL